MSGHTHLHPHPHTHLATSQAEVALALHNLTLTYHRHPVVHHVSGQFAKGVCTAIIGPNGAGKSSLLKALVGLLQPHHGHIDWCGLTRDQLAYLPQQAAIARDFPLSILDAVLLGDWRQCGWFGRISRQQRTRAETALAQVGLAGFGERTLDELSAGQFQRVLFARLIVQDAPLILLDEPFTALDTRTTADLLALVAQWQREGRTVIAVLHDYEQVRSHFSQALLLAKECIAWGNTADVLSPEHLGRAHAISVAWDEQASVCERDASESQAR